MKYFFKSILAFTFLSFALSLLTTNAEAQIVGKIKVTFGTRSRPSSDGNGCESDKGICLIISYKDKVIMQNQGTANLSVLRGGYVQLEITQDASPATERENTFYVHDRITVPADVCSPLGYKSIVLLPGQYTLDKKLSAYGIVQIRADMVKAIITN